MDVFYRSEYKHKKLHFVNKAAEICLKSNHCVKSFQTRNFFWFVFSCIRTEYGDLQSFLWSVFSCIRTEYEDLRRIFPYSVRIQENTDQKKLRIWTFFT